MIWHQWCLLPYLDDVTVFDNFSEELLVLRLVLFLFQFCRMLQKQIDHTGG